MTRWGRGEYDLIHVRMVLMHQPDWRAVLTTLVSALRPGGWLVCEEPDGLSTGLSTDEQADRVWEAMTFLPWDLDCGRALPIALQDAGLADVQAWLHADGRWRRATRAAAGRSPGDPQNQ